MEIKRDDKNEDIINHISNICITLIFVNLTTYLLKLLYSNVIYPMFSRYLMVKEFSFTQILLFIITVKFLSMIFSSEVIN